MTLRLYNTTTLSNTDLFFTSDMPVVEGIR